ncbi:RING-1 like protein [Cordyceps fumosorosea ARSEF 2679]|uniref:RING-type E3 ubiquitin transferase n=1 Tax=Cordyceps fumosorosea (strain ARSEF 2679) TaxID=1081104 RepID=A0A168ENM9_CORFA|nr:RING-1 like protein [Cordyceps fumosorosea ARSEF 2679]OAA74030.1 RING-1 like protein [Cordyceps fumosorosea ARSEF 2679]
MATAAEPPLPSAAPPPPPLPPSATGSSSSSSASPYPFAAAPDIVRAHQKDAYFTGHLATTFTDLHRRLFGARAAHAAAPELRAGAALTYLALTTLPGNRTLGEEYCDLVQVSARERGRLPTLARRAAYIAASVLLPYLAGRALPPLRARLRALLQSRVDRLEGQGEEDGREARLWRYVAAHLTGLTSAAPLQAVTLALFYFRGTYYELAKRALGLRYVFTRDVPDTPDRAGYEVLGVLLVVQLAVRGWVHVREALAETELLAPRERAGFHAAARAGRRPAAWT